MPKQRVLFEAGPMLDSRKTGVGYYVNHLVASLDSAYSDKLDLTGYYFNFLNRHGDKVPAGSPLKFYKVWLIPGKLLSVCRRLGFQPFLEVFVPRKFDTVIFTNYVILPRLRKPKTILVVYDLGFLDVPEFTQHRNLMYLKRFCPPSIRRADTIITISEFTKARLKHHFPSLKADIIVTPIPPLSDSVQKTKLTKNLLNKGVSEKAYILYVGTIEPRKNLETLVVAYSALDPALKAKYALVLAGGKGWKDEATLQAIAKQQAKGENIILAGYVSDEEKGALYSNAACFVLPSHYEGFGMPILEAMQYGVPAAVSDIPVFREVAGGAATYFDKDSVTDMAEKISATLSDSGLRQDLARRSQNQLENFSWQDNADKVYKALG